MDVSGSKFPAQLATILDAIANAKFISFDLELSGIPPIIKGRGRKATLEERYQELCAAAQKYHILQVGLTCLQEDPRGRGYLAKTYNFNLDPLVDERLDMHRDFTFSSSAVDFLLSHGYQIQSAFADAVPYLTRAERARAQDILRTKLDRKGLPDMVIKSDDDETLAFVAKIKADVAAWEKSGEGSSFQIGGPSPHGSSTPGPLSPFQRRVAHQTIRSNFPNLQSNSKDHGVCVKELDPEEQAQVRSELMSRVNDKIFRHTGFSWVAEALARGDLSGLNLDAMAADSLQIANKQCADVHEYKRCMQAILQRLRGPPVGLIGHNCFLDLVYFFHTFYGPLPATLPEFVAQVHRTFPLVIDTKHIFSAQCTVREMRNQALFQITDLLQHVTYPALDASDLEAHSPNGGESTYHEAGFDSFMTATVFLKLAGQLATKGKLSLSTDDDDSASGRGSPTGPLHAKFDGDKQPTRAQSKPTMPPLAKKKQPPSTQATPNGGRFASTNQFDALDQALDEAQDTATLNDVAENPASSAAGVDHQHDELARQLARMRLDRATHALLLPRLDDPFWTPHVNKLRVNGTLEEEIDLAGAAVAVDDSRGSADAVGQEGAGRRISLFEGILGAFGRR